MASREWEVASREWEMASGEWGMGVQRVNREWFAAFKTVHYCKRNKLQTIKPNQ